MDEDRGEKPTETIEYEVPLVKNVLVLGGEGPGGTFLVGMIGKTESGLTIPMLVATKSDEVPDDPPTPAQIAASPSHVAIGIVDQLGVLKLIRTAASLMVQVAEDVEREKLESAEKKEQD